MIPLSTTTISVLRIPVADEYDEPYDGAGEPERDVVATGVRAVIDYPTGGLQLEGGQQNVIDYGLKCDPIDGGLQYPDWIKDEYSSRTFRIVWFLEFPGSHVEARMRDTEGEV
jgi:hypothetical protein